MAPLSNFHAKATPIIHHGLNDCDIYVVESIPDRRLQHSVHVMFDASTLSAISIVESSSNDENSGIFSCAYESSGNEKTEHDDIEIDFSKLGGDVNDEDSNKLCADSQDLR